MGTVVSLVSSAGSDDGRCKRQTRGKMTDSAKVCGSGDMNRTMEILSTLKHGNRPLRSSKRGHGELTNRTRKFALACWALWPSKIGITSDERARCLAERLAKGHWGQSVSVDRFQGGQPIGRPGHSGPAPRSQQPEGGEFLGATRSVSVIRTATSATSRIGDRENGTGVAIRGPARKTR